jgi:hypothetical protein
MTKAQILTLVKATLFASFGAGVGASLTYSLAIGVDELFRGSLLPYDCSTLAYCGLTVANAALTVIT